MISPGAGLTVWGNAARGQFHTLKPKVGFYGCNGRVVSMIAEETTRPPRMAVVTCPACDRSHKVSPMWRNATRSEIKNGRQADIQL